MAQATTPELSTFLEHFLDCCEEFDKVYVVFDAFDECDDDHIIAMIAEFPIRVMLTSRFFQFNLIQNHLLKSLPKMKMFRSCLAIEKRERHI